MDFYANEGKAVTIQANGKTYARHAITTHFVQVGENYIDLLERYVIPVYQPGDILSASEKVIALCQGRVVTEEQVKPGFWAKLLSRFVHQTAAGPGMGLPVKMQFAINSWERSSRRLSAPALISSAASTVLFTTCWTMR